MPCECDLRHRRWNPNTGRCETCRCNYVDERYEKRNSGDGGVMNEGVQKDVESHGYWLPGGSEGEACPVCGCERSDDGTCAGCGWEPSKKDVSGKLGHHNSADMTEDEFLERYKKEEYPKPSVTTDLVIFTILDNDLKVLLIKRGGHPYKGSWALPGGFLDVGEGEGEKQGEDLDTCAHRELAEETGLPEGACFLEQLYTFGNAGRDPRTRVVTVAYYALVSPDKAKVVQAGDDATEAEWVSVAGSLLEMTDPSKRMRLLAFDHTFILEKALERIRGKIDYAPIAFELVPETFTVAELRRVYEVVKGQTYDPANFTKRFRRMVSDGIILPAEGKRQARSGGRPAKVYLFNRG